MTETIFYKKRLVAEEDGLLVVTDKLVSIHETPCFHFCIPEHDRRHIEVYRPREESELYYARRRKMLKRVSKKGSRIAFETEEKALEHLKMLKRKQLGHMKRESVFIEKFLSSEELEKAGRDRSRVPGSSQLVNEYFNFDC